MPERIPKKRKKEHEKAYAEIFDTVAQHTCPETGTLDLDAANERLAAIRRDFIDRGSSVDHYRTILGHAIHDLMDMRSSLRYMDPQHFTLKPEQAYDQLVYRAIFDVAQSHIDADGSIDLSAFAEDIVLEREGFSELKIPEYRSTTIAAVALANVMRHVEPETWLREDLHG